MTPVEMRPKQFGQGEDILPVWNGMQNLVFNPLAVGQHAFLMAATIQNLKKPANYAINRLVFVWLHLHDMK